MIRDGDTEFLYVFPSGGDFYDNVQSGGKKFCLLFSDAKEMDQIRCNANMLNIPKSNNFKISNIDYNTMATSYSVYVYTKDYSSEGRWDVWYFGEPKSNFEAIGLPAAPDPPYYFVQEDGTIAPLEDLAL